VLTKVKPGGQADERDAIIISIGYGKDRAGNLPQRFGPLLPERGRRRLNVVVTRARQKVTVVSSFSQLDLDLTCLRSGSGAELLRGITWNMPLPTAHAWVTLRFGTDLSTDPGPCFSRE